MGSGTSVSVVLRQPHWGQSGSVGLTQETLLTNIHRCESQPSTGCISITLIDSSQCDLYFKNISQRKANASNMTVCLLHFTFCAFVLCTETYSVHWIDNHVPCSAENQQVSNLTTKDNTRFANWETSAREQELSSDIIWFTVMLCLCYIFP